MAKITKEILTDNTGKEIKKAIDNLKDIVVAANTAKFDEESTLLEVTDARGNFQSLGQRLNKQEEDIVELENNYIIEEIEYFTGKINDTDYFIAHIPHLDNNGNTITLKSGFALNNNTATAGTDETAVDFALRNYASFCVNASIFGVYSDEENFGHAMGCMVKDSQLISNYDNAGYTTPTQNRMRILGVKEDGSLKTYPFNTSYDSLIADGVVNSFSGYGTFIENSQYVLNVTDSPDIWNFICQNTTTKDLYFICCNGRDIDGEPGIKPSDLADLMVSTYNCDYGFMIDGGGSTTFVKNGVMLNTPYDKYGTEIRKTPNYIYFSKSPESNIDYNNNMILKFISETKTKLDEIYNRLYYLYNIHNNRLNFNFPNIRNSTDSGIRFRYTKEDILKSQILFDTNENPLALSLFDNENNKTVARIDGLNEILMMNNKIIGKFFDTAYNISDPNDVVTSGIFRMPGNITNSPFGLNIGGILVSIKGTSGGIRQIAIPQVSDSTTEPWFTRQSNSNGTTWETWKIMFTPSNPE